MEVLQADTGIQPFKKHGKWGVGEYHKGDITFLGERNGTITMTTDEWCIGCGDETKIF